MSTSVSRDRRRQFWVDPYLQGSLVFRVVMYWLVCLLTVGIVLMIGAALSDIQAPVTAVTTMLLHFYVPAILASLLVLPVIVLDCIRHSNRFAGPVVRFRQAMERLAEGETASPLIVREGDPWKYLADQFNQIALRMEELENAQQGESQETSSDHSEEAFHSTSV
ncbi:hypothetical protein [Blastopirellula marina]|nr:hypothetical protein [Blastopirellula marina]